MFLFLLFFLYVHVSTLSSVGKNNSRYNPESVIMRLKPNTVPFLLILSTAYHLYGGQFQLMFISMKTQRHISLDTGFNLRPYLVDFPKDII